VREVQEPNDCERDEHERGEAEADAQRESNVFELRR